ncbi:hypothetical protein CYMTET_22720 [Cymbomonas tetramitiformis]|uniref:Uncharacterized protein n=1 Tax=Cymbomonas tetramitiformis TaxID=36881 RepID=A0AAE0G0S5_9CHLO|nr:hypothetical protein CYMTET_22720 [Cymbomonas tetramitiformis]
MRSYDALCVCAICVKASIKRGSQIVGLWGAFPGHQNLLAASAFWSPRTRGRRDHEFQRRARFCERDEHSGRRCGEALVRQGFEALDITYYAPVVNLVSFTTNRAAVDLNTIQQWAGAGAVPHAQCARRRGASGFTAAKLTTPTAEEQTAISTNLPLSSSTPRNS